MAFFSVPSLQDMGLTGTGLVPLPTKVGPDVALPSRGAITSGSQLDRTAVGPWPRLMPAEVANDTFTGWVRNTFHDFFKVSVGANYGGRGSLIDYGFRGSEFPIGNRYLSIAGYPGPVRAANRPTYDNLEPIQWNEQVLTPLNMNPQAFGQIQANPTQFVPGGTASLGINGPVLY